MNFTILYMNIIEIIDIFNKRVDSFLNQKKKDEYYVNEIMNQDIFIINKDKEVVDIICNDKNFWVNYNKIINKKNNATMKYECTKSYRCYIIEYEEILKNITYNEFYGRYSKEKNRGIIKKMDEIEVNIENIEDESNSYSDDDLYNINSWGADLSFRELILMYKEDELLKPELQRKYVWTKNEASRFIDSILLGLPVPSIFLAKTSGEKRLIVDGYQRIMTVYDYVEGIFGGDGKVFKLSNSDIINKKWRGKSFLELTPDEKTKIKTTTIHAIIFEQKHPNNDTGMYQIFERINTSGKILKPQEIRNCVYSGAFNKLLMDLNKEPIWRDILGNEKEDSRMADIELLLRFFAMSYIKESDEINQKQINLTKYLNKYMGNNRNIDEEKCELFKDIFIKVISIIFSKLGDKSFRNYSIQDGKIKFTKRIHPVIFDAICSATVNAINNKFEIEKVDDMEIRYINLLNDEKFKDAISMRTTNIDNIKTRINLASKHLYGVIYEW